MWVLGLQRCGMLYHACPPPPGPPKTAKGVVSAWPHPPPLTAAGLTPPPPHKNTPHTPTLTPSAPGPPQDSLEVSSVLALVRHQWPGAVSVATSSLQAWADALTAAVEEGRVVLPVVEGEIGDTWVSLD